MNTIEPQGGQSIRPHRSFRIHAWRGLICAAVLLISLVVMFRETRYFHALCSLHALIAFLPIILAFMADANDIVYGRRLAFVSLAIYCLALAVPALRLASDLTFGWSAFCLSFVGIGLFAEWGSSGERFWYPIACAMGALANMSFIIGYSAFLAFAIWRKGIRVARWSATLGSCGSLLVIFPLAFSTELNGLFIGYGLWVASMLSLACGSWRVQCNRKNGSLTLQSTS